MENVARRKTAAKDKFEVVSGAEVPPTQPLLIWRFSTFCLLLGCTFVITAGLLTHSSSLGLSPNTRVTGNFQRNTKFTLEDLPIPLPDPMPSIYVQDAVVFPDSVMLLVKVSNSLNLEGSIDSLECQFEGVSTDFTNKTTSSVISIKPRTTNLQIVRCRLPKEEGFPSGFYNNVTLGIPDSDIKVHSNAFYHSDRLPSWNSLVYENVLDSDSLILLAKGLVSKSSTRMDVSSLACVFGSLLPSKIHFQTPVLTAAQEVIRCEKPPAHMEEELRGHRVSVKASWLGVLPSVTYYDPDNRPGTFLASFVKSEDFSDNADESILLSTEEDFASVENGRVMSSVQPIAKTSTSLIEPPTLEEENFGLRGDTLPRRKLCACTMVWNKAKFIREWVIFHSYLGVEKYFVYDNDSDDDIEEVIDSLKSPYNISRMVWPWLKTQQAAFSHCTVLARDECEWMMFSDVDEYIYPYYYLRKSDTEASDAMVLHRMIDRETRMVNTAAGVLGQIQFDCHNFGPSGLKSTPTEGVTVGYTCRMKNPERHKSIIMLNAVDRSLLNVLHHFELQEGYQSLKLLRKVAVVNHYKFQAWDAFRMKFVRRAGTYTTDWRKAENTGSKDRTPGLGTEAVRPDDWESRFCEVHDRGLRDFSIRTFGQPSKAGRLEWEQLNPLPSSNDDE